MNAVKLLVIEDDPYICEIIALYVAKMGYEVVTAADGVDGLMKYYDLAPDLVVLDLMLPEMDGWSVCREIRRDGRTPVIILTAKTERYDKIRGFDCGADDYVVKPFDPQELMARIKAVLRRSDPLIPAYEPIRLGELVVDMNQYAVLCGASVMPLPPKEMELLYHLALRPGRVFTRQQLLDRIWGEDYDGDPRTVDVHIKRIRDKLRAHEFGWSIATVRGIGYKLREGSEE